MEGFVSLKEQTEHETVVKKSRFICSLVPVKTPEQAGEELAKVRKKHYNATHNCSAMVIGEDGAFLRVSDDGEPQGTAGIPMLEVLKKSGVTNILAVVTRYFGGTLLGAGGLVRAYSGSVAQALTGAALLRNIPADVYGVAVPYHEYGKLCSVAAEFGVGVDGTFAEQVSARIVLPKSLRAQFEDRLTQAFMGVKIGGVTGECLLKESILK